MKFSHVLLLGPTLLLLCTNDRLSGPASDSDTAEAAMVYNPDLTPAVDATVRFFEVNDTTRTAAFETKTDSSGRYSTVGVVKGTYNILASRDSFLVFQDSVLISPDTSSMKPDTFGEPGSVTAIAGLQPSRDPRTVTVQVLGTNIFSNVDSVGRFTLAPLAKGTYNLRLATTLADYAPTFAQVSARNDVDDTLADTLWLTSAGIPVVARLSATYDTLNGLVRLGWNPVVYRNLQDYVIYRDSFGSVTPSTDPISARTDTLFVDTVFKRGLSFGQFSFLDTNDYVFKYRVAVASDSVKRGETDKCVNVVAASPLKVVTAFQFTTWHVSKGFYSDSASINDSIRVVVALVNPTRGISQVTWTDLTSQKAIRKASLGGATRERDTALLLFDSKGTKHIECDAEDLAGHAWRDTFGVKIVADAPMVSISSPVGREVPAGDTVALHATANDHFGVIVKYEWDIGNTGHFVVASGGDTAVIAPDSAQAAYTYTVRVTDDDGNLATASLLLRVTAAPDPPGKYEFANWYRYKQAALSITFDDATLGQFVNAEPLMNQYGFQGTFFVPLSAVAGGNGFPPWAMLQDAVANGHEIGSHTMYHTDVTSLDSAQTEFQLKDSRDTIDAHLPSQKCVSFAWPWGRHNDRGMRVALRYYIGARTAVFGCQGPIASDYFAIPAIPQNPLTQYTNSHLAGAIQLRQWMVEMVHSVGGTDSGSVPTANFAAHLDYVKSFEGSLWIAPFGEVVRYVRERQSAVLQNIATTDSIMRFNLIDTLPDSIYNVPLTVGVALDQNWRSATVTQGGNPVWSSFSRSGGVHVTFDAVPDQGEIIIRDSL